MSTCEGGLLEAIKARLFLFLCSVMSKSTAPSCHKAYFVKAIAFGSSYFFLDQNMIC